MFVVRFDFDSVEYQQNINKYEKLKTKPYHFTETGRKNIKEACTILARLSKLVIRSSKLRNRLLRENFGTDSNTTLTRNLTLLNNVINNPSRTVTFVDGSNRRVRVKVDPQNLDNPQRLMNKPYSKAVMDGAGAWVHTLPGTGAPRKPGEYHVGSGMRIILGKAFSSFTTKYQRAGVIYHELTHKVLGTNDHNYKIKECKALASKNTPKAMKNANNYYFFIKEFGEQYDRGVRV